MTRRVIIKDGHICGFADEVEIDGVRISDATTTRVSRVLPTNRVKRLLFVLLRAVVSDKSGMAQWSREWKGPWLVSIDGENFGPFASRDAAIRFEKDKIHAVGKLFLG